MPKISIIVPVYNVEKYLSVCLDSLLSQTLTDIEIICVNDGSTDDSLNILNKMSQKDSRIKIFSQKNLGAGPARNKGILNSIGEYIAFMDPDDFYPDKFTLEKLYKAAIKNQANICGGSLQTYENGKVSEPCFKEAIFEKEGFLYFKEYQFDYYYQRFIYKKKFLMDNNLYFPDYRRGQDLPFFIKAMTLSEKFYALKDITYCYRISGNTSALTESKKIYDLLKGFEDCLKFTDLHELYNLHYKIAKRLNSYFFIRIFKIPLRKFNPFVIVQLNKAINSINITKVKELDRDFVIKDTIEKYTLKGFFKNILSIKEDKETGKTVLYLFFIRIRIK